MKEQVKKVLEGTDSGPKFNAGLSLSYQDMTELQLIELCQRGDRAAFRQLIKTYERYVLRVLYKLAPDMRDKSDLAQEVLIRMWKSIGRLKNPHAFRAWMIQITTNAYYDELRRHRPLTVSLDSPRYQDDDDDMPPIQLADQSPLPDELFELRELRQMMEKALVQLPSQFGLVMKMRDVDGLSYQQISDITHCGLGTVKSRISRARTKMQHILSPYLSAADSVEPEVRVREALRCSGKLRRRKPVTQLSDTLSVSELGSPRSLVR